VGGLGPCGVFGSKSYASQDWLSNYGVLKIERFGGRPPVGGRPGVRGPRSPLNPAVCLTLTLFVGVLMAGARV